MIWIKRLASAITATQVGLAIALPVAAAVFFNLAIVHRTQTAQVAEDVRSTGPAANDMIDTLGLISASWDCAGVPITVQCSGTQSMPSSGAVEWVRHGSPLGGR
jgi:hypothetical protein